VACTGRRRQFYEQIRLFLVNIPGNATCVLHHVIELRSLLHELEAHAPKKLALELYVIAPQTRINCGTVRVCGFYLVLGGGCVLPSPSLISSIILGSRTFRHTMFSRTAFTLRTPQWQHIDG
jgi:hypothetical protein